MQNNSTAKSDYSWNHATIFKTRRYCLLLMILTTLQATSMTAYAVDDPMAFFEKNIRPVLVENCYECHSASSKSIKAGLRLDTKSAMLQGGDSGPVIIPGKPDDSTLLMALNYEGDAVEMPPKGKLPESVINHFRQWIAEGAYDPRLEEKPAGRPVNSWSETFRKRLDWWSFKPLANVQPPSGLEPHPIDAFLASSLKAKGLGFAKESDRLTLLRRLSFDLTGLPPTEDEIRAFLADTATSAYENQVERLLASPHFGERLARRWMDLTHYTETVGSEQDALIPYAWAYRDYLIRAFNQDLPYNQLLTEHLAGDLISEPRRDPVTGFAESPIGTGWLRFVEYYHSPVDVKNEEVVVIDNQVDTLSKTFLGLTVACARCHDHKFDPIGTDDFYRLYGALRTARANVHTLADPRKIEPQVKQTLKHREEVRRLVAQQWQASLPKLQLLIESAFQTDRPIDPKLTEFFKISATSPQKWAFPLAKARQAIESKNDLTATLESAFQAVAEQGTASWHKPDSKQTLLADFSDSSKWPEGWTIHSQFTPVHSPAGTFRMGHKPEQVVEFLRPSGFYSDAISEKLGATLRSPEFTLTGGTYSVLVSGTSNARLRLVVDNFQGVDILFSGVTPVLNNPRLAWVKLPTREIWNGQQAYLELVTRDNMPSTGVIRDLNQLPKDGRSTIGIKYVVHHENNAVVHEQSAAITTTEKLRAEESKHISVERLTKQFQEWVAGAISAFSSGSLSDFQAQILQDLIDARLIPNESQPESELAKAIAAFRAEEEKIDLSARSSGVSEDGKSQIIQQVFLRGDHHKTGIETPPGDLKLNSEYSAFPKNHSPARLALAQSWTKPGHPLVNRVIANRLWSWYFGKGLFATVDNLGLLGEQPSHPQLLDWLAAEFDRQGRSLKNMTRLIVTSRAYRQSSTASEKAHEIDPTNTLLSHASLRRLDAESLRDSILTATGRLDRTLYGLPIPTPQPPGLTDDKKPVSGPVDGYGRRSIYLNVRKNFPIEFLEVFDRPRPTLTVGRRNVSNQPAQALALLNDPFVKGEAERLGEILKNASGQSVPQRIQSLYLRLYGRFPSETETERSAAFLNSGGSWTELVGALFGTKEFIFLN